MDFPEYEWLNKDLFRRLSKDAVSEIATKAKNGDTESQLKLGACYLYGQEVDTDFDEALKWFKKCSNREPLALYYCAFMTEFAMGTEQRIASAVDMYYELYQRVFSSEIKKDTFGFVNTVVDDIVKTLRPEINDAEQKAQFAWHETISWQLNEIPSTISLLKYYEDLQKKNHEYDEHFDELHLLKLRVKALCVLHIKQVVFDFLRKQGHIVSSNPHFDYVLYCIVSLRQDVAYVIRKVAAFEDNDEWLLTASVALLSLPVKYIPRDITFTKAYLECLEKDGDKEAGHRLELLKKQRICCEKKSGSSLI